MITEESINFLKNIPPFQFLDDDSLRMITANLSLEFYPRNAIILSQDGPPSDSLRIIKKGLVKVYLSNDEEIEIDYRGEGDSFGYLSLISGDKSRANVIAVEDTLCYQVPRGIILKIINMEPLFSEYFMKSFFKNYLDRTYKEMRNRNVLFMEGEKLLYTTPVKDLISRPAVTAPSGISINEAASLMSRHRISSLVLLDQTGTPSGIVTDRDLRDRVVSKNTDPSLPVTQVMSGELISIDASRTCFDALSTMMNYNIHHLLIIEDRSLIGVVTNHDFMVLQGTSPLSLLKNIDRQRNPEALLSIHAKISGISGMLLKQGVRTSHIIQIITELNDRLLRKIIELSVEEVGGCSHPFAFFVYASEGRKEQTYKSPFHCAIVYDKVETYSQKNEIESFCSSLMTLLKNTFDKCGLPFFETHPFGESSLIYGEISDWESNILRSLSARDEEHYFTGKIMLDARTIFGHEPLVITLKNRLYKQIRDDQAFYHVLQAQEPKTASPISFLKHLVANGKGGPLEKFDIKDKAVNQIVDALRILAITYNIHETSTLERLEILARRDIVPPDLKQDATSALEFLLHLLLQHQLIQKQMDLEINDFIDPQKLSILEKKTLKEVFQIIMLLQKFVDSKLKDVKAAVE